MGQEAKLICMIRVLNEEKKIRRCLESMPFVDRFIIMRSWMAGIIAICGMGQMQDMRSG